MLYDNFGKLTLKNIEDMKVNYIVMPATAENFDYSTSIDGETYNQIKLSYDNKETGKRDIYIAMHSENINKWGLLQMYEKVQSGTGIPDRALAMLSLYNRKSRSLSIKNALGDLDVRAGSSVGVALNLGDIEVNSFFICEKVTHTFKGDMHLMDLSLRGSDFIV